MTTDEAQSLWKKTLETRLAVFWFCFFSLTSLGSAILAALQGVSWDGLDAQTKFMIGVAIFVSWGNTIAALLKTVGKKVEQGKSVFDDDGTQYFKATTTVKQKPPDITTSIQSTNKPPTDSSPATKP